MFSSVNTKHTLLQGGIDYEVDRNQIKLLLIEDGDVQNPTISVRYKHRPEYTIVDMSRDVMVFKKARYLIVDF